MNRSGKKPIVEYALLFLLTFCALLAVIGAM